ncbi:MAG: EAL domain-containing protein [Gammaproteobacteria bacterium]|nr:EAL domain-containing protein [Gammaproteobacteria bacterium]
MLDPSQQNKLYRARNLFKSAFSANITLLAGTALIATYYYAFTDTLLTIWILAMYIVVSCRILIAQQYFIDQKNDPKKLSIQSWLNIYTASSLATGLATASLVLFMPDNITSTDINVMYITFFAIAAGSATHQSNVLAAYLSLITPIFVAAFAFSFFTTSEFTLFLSAGSVIFYTYAIVSARLLNKRYVDNFSLIIKNEELINKLHDEISQKVHAQKKLIHNQEKLEEKVVLRTKELSDMNETLVDEINERLRIESNLKHLAHHDALTNLPNRLLLDARLNHAIERAKRDDLQVAVMFLDLDHFKTINDSLGHDVGDQLLISISRRLLNCVREDDTVARLGGDEFIIIIEQVRDIGDLDALLKKIMKVTSQPAVINNHELITSTSIGISIYPDDGKNAEQLMRNADAAMYHVKENGRNKYHFYTRDLTSSAYDRVIVEYDLKRAIENKEIQVYYQPQVSLDTNKIVGVEALVRWDHPKLGILPPKQFLYIADQTGLINDIGEIVLTTACQQIVKWKQQGLPIETVAVNLAGNQIYHGDLVTTVKTILQKTNCKKEWLELETTEDIIIQKPKQSISTLQKLHDLGVSLAIDDFGTGYSSLSYLKQLPVNKVKIDRSFIRDISDDKEDATLVLAIITMGKSLNLKLIAEGVEHSAHETFLRTHGCEYAQGYLYSGPVPAEDIEKLFADKDKERRKNIKLISRQTK